MPSIDCGHWNGRRNRLPHLAGSWIKAAKAPDGTFDGWVGQAGWVSSAGPPKSIFHTFSARGRGAGETVPDKESNRSVLNLRCSRGRRSPRAHRSEERRVG